VVTFWLTQGLARLPSQYSSRLTQPGHPSVGRCTEYWRWFRPSRGKKRRVLRSSRPRDADLWCTGWSRLKALDVNLSQHHSGQLGLYASLTVVGSQVIESYFNGVYCLFSMATGQNLCLLAWMRPRLNAGPVCDAQHRSGSTKRRTFLCRKFLVELLFATKL